MDFQRKKWPLKKAEHLSKYGNNAIFFDPPLAFRVSNFRDPPGRRCWLQPTAIQGVMTS